ncbi:hypothetical protein [Olsenella sp. Marseille-P4559]|uniref:hypothetical protein n=1 Tax=Olsenella sp. Marseille-P4559 TaxID=2364795 RepID=UPI0010316019|nr:hypothetical protein [Olsenella sp. Marseille-P4559]
MPAQMTVVVDGESIGDVRVTCENAGTNLSGAIVDVPEPSGSSDALAAFCEQARRLNDLVTRYGAVITKDAGTLRDAIDQFEGWDGDTASRY